jgi:F0F1-type ATP synthase membrane subunit a
MTFIFSMPRIALGFIYALLFGVLIRYQLKIAYEVRSQLSNAYSLQEKTPVFADRVSFYDQFNNRSQMTIILSCIAFLCIIFFSIKNTQQDIVTIMTQIAVVIGTFIFFFSIKLLSFCKQSDQQYNTSLTSSAVVNLSLTGLIIFFSMILVIRYGKIKEWNILKFILNPDWLRRFSNLKKKI